MRLALLLVLLAPAAEGDLVAEAFEQFERGEFDQALETIDRAIATNSDPNLLFSRAVLLENLERYDEAIEGYEKFLATGPNRERAGKAYDRIQACRRALEEQEEDADEAVSEPPPPVVEPEPTPDPNDGPPPQPRPWHRDPLGGVLLGTGSAMLVAGGVLVGVGASRRLAAPDGSTEDGFRQDLRSSTTLQITGIAVAVTGGLLVGGAALRYMKVKRASVGPDGLALRF
jgi:tetratricopeptide (TPR) repeat protein